MAAAAQQVNASLPKAPAASIQSVSHLTNLLKNASGPPNVNVQQIQQQSPSVAGLSNSAIQSILSGALSSGVISNGPTPAPAPLAAPNVTVVRIIFIYIEGSYLLVPGLQFTDFTLYS